MNSAGTQLYMGSGGWCRFLSGREETHHHDPHFYPDAGARPQAKSEAFLSGQAKGISRFWGRFYPDLAEASGWEIGGPVYSDQTGPNGVVFLQKHVWALSRTDNIVCAKSGARGRLKWKY